MRWMTSGGRRPLTDVAPMRTLGELDLCDPPRRPCPEPNPWPVPTLESLPDESPFIEPKLLPDDELPAPWPIVPMLPRPMPSPLPPPPSPIPERPRPPAPNDLPMSSPHMLPFAEIVSVPGLSSRPHGAEVAGGLLSPPIIPNS